MLMKLNVIFKSDKLLVILSAILYSIPYINFDLYILHWFFLLPILYLIEFKNTNIIFTGLLFGVTSSFIGQYWITETLMNIAGVSFSNGILIHTIYSLYESIFFIIIFFIIKKIFSEKKFYIIKFLILIFAWICIENIFPRIFPYKLGNSQINFKYLSPLIGFFGINIISFFVLALNITLHFIYRRRNIFKYYKLYPLIFLIFFLGIKKEHSEENYKSYEKSSIKIVQPNNEKNNLRLYSATPVLDYKIYDLTIWPESSMDFIDLDNIDQVERFRKDFKTNYPFNSKELIFGTITKRNDNFYNSAILINKNNDFKNFKNKKKLLIYGEYYPFKEIISKLIPIYKNYRDLVPGKNKPIKLQNESSVFIFICYEDLFADDLANIVSDNDIGYLINITNDIWYGNSIAAYQHLMLSLPRAIEANKFLVRSANNGISAVISPKGKIIKKIDLNNEGSIFYEIPIIKKKTIYHSYYKIIETSYYLILILLVFIKKIFYTREN